MVDRAADALRRDPVYVDHRAVRRISAEDAQRLRGAIRRERAGPLYVAVLPGFASNESGGDDDAVVRDANEGRRAAGALVGGMASW